MTRIKTLTLTLDTQRFQRAMRQLSREVGKFIDAAGAMAQRISRLLLPLADRDIRRYGPRNLLDDGRWQSDMCAGWVHDACPSGRCDCTCHGGSLL